MLELRNVLIVQAFDKHGFQSSIRGLNCQSVSLVYSMSTLGYILISPLLLLFSIPMVIFATITTTLAFSTLLLRALILYAELGAALVQDQFVTHTPSKGTSKSLRRCISSHEAYGMRRKGRRSSAASASSNGGSITPKAPDTSGLAIFSQALERDFEGIGGWRPAGQDDEDVLWTNMNSRLELPTMAENRQRNHRRSNTSSSLTSLALASTSPTESRARTHSRSHLTRPSSPEEFFRNRPPSKSTTSLDTANIGKPLLRRKPSSSSGSSPGSARTLHLTSPNG